MIIQVEARTIYGTLKFYPMNEAAHLLCRLTGTKTLSREALALANKLGHQTTEIHTNQLGVTA